MLVIIGGIYDPIQGFFSIQWVTLFLMNEAYELSFVTLLSGREIMIMHKLKIMIRCMSKQQNSVFCLETFSEHVF